MAAGSEWVESYYIATDLGGLLEEHDKAVLAGLALWLMKCGNLVILFISDFDGREVLVDLFLVRWLS